jgi:hypothetical protein
MRVNQDDVTGSGKLTAPSSMRTTLTYLRPAVGEHVGSGGMRQERRVSGLLSRGYGGMGVWGQYRCREFLQDRVGT